MSSLGDGLDGHGVHPLGGTRVTSNLGAASPASVLVTFDQQNTLAPALTATVAIDNQAPNYGAQGTFNAPVTFNQTVAASVSPLLGLSAQDRHNRARMLAKVRDFWVGGVLEGSLQGAALLALGLEQRPAAVVDPFAGVVQRPEPKASAVTPSTRIADVFAAVGGELLILGAPGAGKTTLLLDLARDLLARAERDEALPLPVVFNLSAWAARRAPLAVWLVDELNVRYDVSRQVGQAWVVEDKILPLLDGLDEVQQEHRAACLVAINRFRGDHGTSIVVCSRLADYEALTGRLKLQGAVLIQPLGASQIDAYLARAGDQLAGLRAALPDDEGLLELATSPLMLSIMAMAYQGVSIEALGAGSSTADRRRHLFAAYVEKMFKRNRIDARYSPGRTIHWLRWLAKQMVEQGQTLFLIERLQPEWLPTRAQRWRYTLLDRGSGALGTGLIGGLVSGLSVGLVDGLRYGLVDGLLYGLLYGLIGGFFGGESIPLFKEGKKVLHTLRGVMLGALVVGLAMALSGGVNYGVMIDGRINGVIDVLRSGLLNGLVGVLIGGIAGALAGAPSICPRHVIVVETLQWSWSKARRTMVAGLVGGLVIGLSVGLFYGQILGPVDRLAVDRLTIGFRVGLNWGLFYGLVLGLIGGLIGGLDSAELMTRVTPNLGISRSARTAAIVGLVGGLVGALVGWLFYRLLYGQAFGLFGGLFYGPLSALVFGLAHGGYACLSHFTLRLVLWHSDAMPWRYARFLDYAAERLFLHKVGGGYIFVHRLLLEYFADLPGE